MNSKSWSRRHFLTATGGLTFAITAGVLLPRKRSEDEGDDLSASGQELTAWVNIQPDGRIRIYSPAAEMGQGSMTALGIIIAEEMDAEWRDVEIIHAPIEPDTYGLQWGGKLGGPMITVGSRTVRGYYHGLRHAGAQARFALMQAVASKHRLDITSLSTSPSKVEHEASNRSWSYSEIATFAKQIDIPEIPEEKWKKRQDFRLIGKPLQRVDIPDKVKGIAQFAIDVQLPGMVYASMQRSLINGSTPIIKNESEIKSMPGVQEVVSLPHGIAVVADSYEQALTAKKALDIEWSGDVKATGYDSQNAFDRYISLANSNEPGKVLHDQGDVKNLGTDQIFERTYKNDFAYHAQMEPLNAVVSISADGKSADAWVGSQSTDGARRTVAKTLQIDFERVDLHPCYLGGGFGRRSMSDYLEETTLIAKAVRKPVKLIWSREDDMQYGAFRPISVQKIEASVDKSGKLNSWKHITAGTGGGLMTSGVKIPYYNIPNQLIELRDVDEGVRTKHWRSVGHGPNKYAIEAFIDELCLTHKIDPLQMRLDLLRQSPREKNVVERVAKISDWGADLPDGRARGMAFGERSGALVAGVAEISLSNNKIKVHHFWCAMDAGVVVHLDNAVAQLEGGIIFGISSSLKESITFVDGKVQQSNFHDYQLLRIDEAPESIQIDIIESDEAPMGIGEASLPVVGGAIANAFLALTGKALRHMPFNEARIKEVIG